MKRSFSYSAANIWNNQDINIRSNILKSGSCGVNIKFPLQIYLEVTILQHFNIFNFTFLSHINFCRRFCWRRHEEDHLELFNSAIRGMNGWNNNPTCTQFKAAYHRLLHLHDNMLTLTGNLALTDSAKVLTSVPESCTTICPNNRKYDVGSVAKDPDPDYCLPAVHDSLSPALSTTITYIAGFVTRKLIQTVKCKHCACECSLYNQTTRKW